MTPAARTACLAAAVGLAVTLLVAVLATTPWQALPAGAPRVPADPTRDFTAAEIERARTFVRQANVPGLLAWGLGIAIAVVLGLTPLGARLVGAVGRVLPDRWWLRAAAGVVVLLAIGAVAVLPLHAWRHTVSRRWGLSVQGWGGWALDQLRGFALGAALTLVAVLALLALVRALPRTWWVPAAAGGAALVLAVSFVYPLVVEPLFNRFTSMPAGELRDDLLALAAADGVPVTDVLVADASRRTTALNAYVSGFGATRRIVVYDTLLERPPAEVRLVVAHELGHAARHDVLHGTALGALAMGMGVCLLGLALSSPGLLRRAGVPDAGDPRVVALVLALATLAGTVGGPVQQFLSRRIEARADVHALDLTRDPEVFVDTKRALAVTNLSNPRPNPLLFALFASHPSIPQRLALARAWAAHEGVPVPADRAPSPAATAEG